MSEKDPLVAMGQLMDALEDFDEERQVRIMLSAAILLGISEIDPVKGRPMLPGSRPVIEDPSRRLLRASPPQPGKTPERPASGGPPT